MIWEKVAQYDGGNGPDLGQTFAEMHKRKMRPPSLLELDEHLVDTDKWRSEQEIYPCRSGVFMCYPNWGEPFGKKLEWEGYTVLIPKKFQGKKEITLACNFVDVKLAGKTFSSANFTAIRLPHLDGWYDTEKKFGLPIGERKEESGSRRKLWRYQEGAFCGLVLRWGGDFGFGYRRVVVCDGDPDDRCGVFGIPLGKGGTAKKETLADECERLRGENAELQTGNDKLRDALGKIAKAAEEAKNA